VSVMKHSVWHFGKNNLELDVSYAKSFLMHSNIKSWPFNFMGLTLSEEVTTKVKLYH
jgi:hypothetical protein